MSAEKKHYVVTAYRWGQRNAHSFVVAAYTDLESAKKCANEYVSYRGGKYAAEVCAAGGWNEDSDEIAEQVVYFESPYFGMAGDSGHFHPARIGEKSLVARPPFTVRELQNQVRDLERQLVAQTKEVPRA